MNTYYPSQYDSQSLQPSTQGQSSRHMEAMDIDQFAQQNPYASSNSQPVNNDPQDMHMISVPQLQQASTMSHAGMMQQYTTADLNDIQPFSSADFDFVPSSNMNQNALDQSLLMGPGSMFSRSGSQSLASAPQLGPGQGLGLSTAYVNNPDPYQMSSPTSHFGMQASPLMDLSPQYMSPNMSMDMNFHNDAFQNLGSNSMGFNMMQQQQQHQPDQRQQLQNTAQALQYQQNQQTSSQQPLRRQSLQSEGGGFQGGPMLREDSVRSDMSRRHSVPAPLKQYDPQNQTIARMQTQNMPENGGFPWQGNQLADPGSAMSIPTLPPQPYQNAYSSTGFDMLSILMRVASRKTPEINIGPVDLSCAFVVCDAREHDIPIVYCSENFEKLTGYTKYEILGRSCRFLQAPDGKVQAGIKRKYVDDDSIWYLKKTISQQRESQVSIINYRKGGQPFMNLLTVIPVTDEAGRIEYFVGFQVDLVEQPNSVTSKNPDGTYAINYQRGLSMPSYTFQPSAHAHAQTQLESGQTITRDDVSTVLGTFSNGGFDLSKGMWDKVLLENADDVIFVLSLKGLFLYLSPACNKVFEYESSELLQTPLSSVCHPSDIVPVTRELKDTPPTGSVDVVFRLRRKHRGYMWFEARGSLHTEQGKGRKSIILVGRERPVYTLSRMDIIAEGGIGESEIWSKLSTSGMFLFVANNVRQVLDRMPEDLVGTSIQALMRPDSKIDFSRILGIVKTGKRASVKHEVMNKRGIGMQANSTLYPGDAAEGQKPTFVIAQTRIIKYTRPSGSKSQLKAPGLSRGSTLGSLDGGSVTPHSTASTAFTFTAPPGEAAADANRYMSTFESATTYSGQYGLSLGHQDLALASDENLFDELKTTRSTSWQYELRQMEKRNRFLAEELQTLLATRKKRKRRKHGAPEKDCANCHTKQTPEWRRGPSGARDLCNSCGLRYAKQQGRISPRTKKSSNASVGDGVSPKAGSGGGAVGSGSAHGTSPKLIKQSSQSSTHSHSSQGNTHSIAGTLAKAQQSQHGTPSRRLSQSMMSPSAVAATLAGKEQEGRREQIDEDNASNKMPRLESQDSGRTTSSQKDTRTGLSPAVSDDEEQDGEDEDVDSDPEDASGDNDVEEGEEGEEEEEEEEDDRRSSISTVGVPPGALLASNRRSGNPSSGSELPTMIEENVAGEKQAMDEEADVIS